MNGQQIFPVPQEVWEDLAAELEEEETPDSSEFSLGEDVVEEDID